MDDTATTQDWGAVARAWERRTEHIETMKQPVTQLLLGSVAIRPGDRVLELGAGPGVLAPRLAAATGSEGRVVISDVAPAMVEVARRLTAGIEGVEVAVVDATRPSLPAGSFDVALFRMGLMFTPDPAESLAAIRTLLAPSGRIGVAVWAGIEHNPWISSVGMSAMFQGLVTGGPPVGPGQPFCLGDAGALGDLFRSAGFVDVAVTAVDLEARFRDTDEHVQIVSSLAPPLAAAFVDASTADLDAVKRSVAEMTAPHRGPDGLRLPGRALVATAHRGPD